MLLNGKDISKHLSGVEVGGQTIPYGHAGVLGQVFHNLLVKAAVLDTVEHATQHLSGVLERLLLAHL